MTKEDVIRMAKNSGLFVELVLERDLDWLERFAALIASAEREACVNAIKDQIGWDMDDPESTAIKAIRARGQA